MTALSIPLLLALLDWLAVHFGWRRIGYLTKPAVMLALIGWLASMGAIHGALIWFLIALVFSLLGDVFLMLPREQFLAGLVAFLLAHLAYVIGLNPAPPPVNLPALLVALMVGVTGGHLFRTIAARVPPKMRKPMLAYAGVISLMLLSAFLTLIRPDWNPQAGLEVSLGAFLFFLSDTLLAWDRFVRPLKHARLKVRVTYHLGQILLILGAATHFLELPTLLP